MRRDWAFWLSAVTLGVIVASAIFAERLAPYGPNEQDILTRLQPPDLPPTCSAPTRSAATS